MLNLTSPITTEFLNPDLIRYFFGEQFNIEVAETALQGTPQGRDLVEDLLRASIESRPHTGIQLVCWLDLDTGLFVATLMAPQGSPSMISFFISSNHRFFGGQTLMCVPFQYCTNLVPIEGKYLVYRHTFKEPIMSDKEFQKIRNTGTDEEKLRAYTFCRSRDGYRTIPGMSYVGMTQRSMSKRYQEHIDSALENTSSTLFHQAIRDMQGKPVICVHDVSGFGMSKDDAKEYEKHLIRTSTLKPMGLNMKVG